jgi:Zn-dependent protease
MVLFVAVQYESALLLAIAYAGFFINLFNLVPMSPFDGGRIVAILSPRIWFLGAPILLGIFLMIPSPMFLLILILLAPSMWRAVKDAWHGTAPAGNPRYYEVPREARVRYGAYYILLLAYLCVMTFKVHEQLRATAPPA